VARIRYAELERLLERQRVGLPGSVRMSQLLQKFEVERLPLLAQSTQRAYSASITRFRRYFVEALGDLQVDAVRPGHSGTSCLGDEYDVGRQPRRDNPFAR